MARPVQLLIIDPQSSFCHQVEPRRQQELHDGELCIPGAWDDMERVSRLIDRLGSRIEAIHVTLDSHHLLHVAHPIWFHDTHGRHPEPFTIMCVEDGAIIGRPASLPSPSGRGAGGEGGLAPAPPRHFTTIRPEFHGRTVDYLRQLAAAGRYPHCIWPPHCLIGTPGHNIVAPLMEALLRWCRAEWRRIDLRMKGSNMFVEHFSAVRAEVPDPDDPATQPDRGFIHTLIEADEVLLAGEAGSHCLANTVRDVAAEVRGDRFLRRCVLLRDGTSPVPGFEAYQQDFIREMTARGMRTTTCDEYAA